MQALGSDEEKYTCKHQQQHKDTNAAWLSCVQAVSYKLNLRVPARLLEQFLLQQITISMTLNLFSLSKFTADVQGRNNNYEKSRGYYYLLSHISSEGEVCHTRYAPQRSVSYFSVHLCQV